jgi:hypothetical protein
MCDVLWGAHHSIRVCITRTFLDHFPSRRVLEDDGCGVLNSAGLCAQYLTDFACAINCNPNLFVNGINDKTADYGLPSMVRQTGGAG